MRSGTLRVWKLSRDGVLHSHNLLVVSCWWRQEPPCCWHWLLLSTHKAGCTPAAVANGGWLLLWWMLWLVRCGCCRQLLLTRHQLIQQRPAQS